MKDQGFIKGVVVGLSIAVVFIAGRVSASPQDGTDAMRMAKALEKIAAEGVKIKNDYSDQIEVKVRAGDTLPIEIKGEPEIKIEPKWSNFPVEIKK